MVNSILLGVNASLGYQGSKNVVIILQLQEPERSSLREKAKKLLRKIKHVVEKILDRLRRNKD